jgi:hypothetical protein
VISMSYVTLVVGENYECKVQVTDGDGATWTSIDGMAAELTDIYECHISPQYDEVTQEFWALVWLTCNGQLVSDPANCQIWLRDTAGNVPVNVAGTATQLDPNGVFVLEQASTVLTLSTNYECKVQVTDADGNTWTSVLGAISFN